MWEENPNGGKPTQSGRDPIHMQGSRLKRDSNQGPQKERQGKKPLSYHDPKYMLYIV